MQVLMPPFLGPFSSLARFALTGYLPIITPWEGYGVNPVLNNQTGFTTKNPFSEIREKDSSGRADGRKQPVGPWSTFRCAKPSTEACRRQRPGGAARARASGPWGPLPYPSGSRAESESII